MGYVPLGVLLLLVVAAVIDRRDARRGHARRDPARIATERRDLRADLESTQHRGICVPIGDICADRQRRR